jgi:hypothetical protein
MHTLLHDEPTGVTSRPVRGRSGRYGHVRARRTLMIVNGCFLAAVGAVQVVFELLSYFRSGGPYRAIFHKSSYTVGWVEAHGLAVLVGLLFLAVAARDGRRFWHVFAMAVHLLLGTANIVFWHGFTEFGVLPPGIAATIAHGAFVLSHGVALSVSRRRPAGPRDILGVASS